MSGVEAVTVLGAISSVISILDAAVKIYQACQDPQGLHETFQRVAASLPLVIRLLKEAKQEIATQPPSSPAVEAVEMAISSCKKDAKMLEDMFRSFIPGPTASSWKRWSQAVKTVRPGKERKVQGVFRSIADQLQLLHYHSFIRSRDDFAQLQSTAHSLAAKDTHIARNGQDAEPEPKQHITETSQSQTHDSTPKFSNLGSDVYNQSDGQWIQYQDFTKVPRKTRILEDTASVAGLVAPGASASKFQNVGSTVYNQGDNQRIDRQTFAF
ncbi:hypothetical protein PRZ48_007978 [Zasmidium cellare]|uniref:NACHT-NTPase and P-loop NTPases N-terminal domain-containing protein n=1 Tax=Zasmidium cellare TaxID=395010 RepID=A0ABR0EEB8_ZASCE|nr:hypothetical protein PRZ48_007978 [Zasmidium cellare]